MKNALVIGASQKNMGDTRRWDKYFENKDMSWNGPAEYITRDARLLGNGLSLSFDELLDATLVHYDDIYKAITGKWDPLDLIIIDRATVHGLMIDNPIGRPSVDNDGELAVNKYYLLLSKQNSFLTDADSNIGRFNQDVLSLLFFHMLSRLEKGGDLIFDTSSLRQQHVDLLKLFFLHTDPWDFNAAENQVLEYKASYDSGCYNEPSFIKFSGFKGNAHSFDMKTALMSNAFPERLLTPMFDRIKQLCEAYLRYAEKEVQKTSCAQKKALQDKCDFVSKIVALTKGPRTIDSMNELKGEIKAAKQTLITHRDNGFIRFLAAIWGLLTMACRALFYKGSDKTVHHPFFWRSRGEQLYIEIKNASEEKPSTKLTYPFDIVG